MLLGSRGMVPMAYLDEQWWLRLGERTWLGLRVLVGAGHDGHCMYCSRGKGRGCRGIDNGPTTEWRNTSAIKWTLSCSCAVMVLVVMRVKVGMCEFLKVA